LSKNFGLATTSEIAATAQSIYELSVDTAVQSALASTVLKSPACPDGQKYSLLESQKLCVSTKQQLLARRKSRAALALIRRGRNGETSNRVRVSDRDRSAARVTV
jgi:hypothetical protein